MGGGIILFAISSSGSKSSVPGQVNHFSLRSHGENFYENVFLYGTLTTLLLTWPNRIQAHITKPPFFLALISGLTMRGWVSWCPGCARQPAGDCRLAVFKGNLSRKLAQQRAISWSSTTARILSAGRPCSFFAGFFVFCFFF